MGSLVAISDVASTVNTVTPKKLGDKTAMRNCNAVSNDLLVVMMI